MNELKGDEEKYDLGFNLQLWNWWMNESCFEFGNHVCDFWHDLGFSY